MGKTKKFKVPPLWPLTNCSFFPVEVNGYTSSSCEGTDRINNSTLTGAVVHSATVKVYPEGIVKTDTESAYFCANGKILNK